MLIGFLAIKPDFQNTVQVRQLAAALPVGKEQLNCRQKMLMLTQALQLKMEWDFCKKLSITNGLE